MLETPPVPGPLKLSNRSVEILLDLVEVKLGAMEVADRDVRTIGHLRRARDELAAIERVLRALPAPKRGPGRPRTDIYDG